MKTKAEVIYMPDLSTKYRQSLFEAVVRAGFPSPAADYEEDKLDLNKHLIKDPVATFFVGVTGDSMVGAGIHHGDLLVVDVSAGHIVKVVHSKNVGLYSTALYLKTKFKRACSITLTD